TSMSCSTMTMVRSVAMRRTSSTVARVSLTLMPAVGSSRQRSWGSVASAMPISRFRCAPWERLAANSSSSSRRPTESSTARARSVPRGAGWGRRRRPGRYRPGPPPPGCSQRSLRELAGRRKDGLLLRDRLEDPVLVVLDVEDELAEEGLVVLPPQRLVSLGEVVRLLDLHAFQGLDDLHRVFTAAEARLLGAELEEVDGLEV